MIFRARFWRECRLPVLVTAGAGAVRGSPRVATAAHEAAFVVEQLQLPRLGKDFEAFILKLIDEVAGPRAAKQLPPFFQRGLGVVTHHLGRQRAAGKRSIERKCSVSRGHHEEPRSGSEPAQESKAG